MASLNLFSPLQLRGVHSRNRLVISPMCQYSAIDGFANDWHLVHLGRFALGGFGIVMVEATAVRPEGRITPGDIGLWDDAHILQLARIAEFLRENGSVPAIQLAHAGRKASCQRPWHGDKPLMPEDEAARGDKAWQVVAPSAIPHDEGWPTPQALTADDLKEHLASWRRATERALEAGFDIVEIHAAHGYLLHEFLSPLANKREDEYGGSLANRMRFPLEVIETVRSVWPEDKPVFVRVSASDWVEGGWTIEDTVAFAARAKALGVDVLDCSSGGMAVPPGAIKARPGFQVPFAAQVRKEADIATMAVGMIAEPAMAEAIVADGQADLVAIAREALYNPEWPHHAWRALGGDPQDFSQWPVQAGFWLRNRERARAKAQAEATNVAD
ncbi:NADH:flavin oxidoreductase/NADH oxidase [Pedomonas mirosovicensis]|uniref:NADH:flavin oxidoreductase/NADH oxidase n=1 Tax=Pedomonas mirosovicensis TaxID=2908641 RepID=UPI002167F508|nr:NADH:flavin oxidoreductase/NADH oxidase [Pedomonas mirosovicensis]MCH8686286.1 NADH:flavin oxidoreductase/NADH oxidase [Pedomonas mirosovicensis]